jgi:S-adenosylmethionine:tRNA ribosyltransferase-isomerase
VAAPPEGNPQGRASDFDYVLPPELIAQQPAAERSASRLLDGRGLPPADRVFRELPDLLAPGDLMVFNDTRVIKARLGGNKASGGAVEVLVERVLAGADGRHDEVWAHLRASRSPRPGAVLRLAGAFDAEVLGRCGPQGALFHLRLRGEGAEAAANAFALLERHGHVPLPPYITHADGAEDAQRYQSLLAREPGAVAAPTASLHFDQALLDALDARGIERATLTLHVGAGTFQPVREEDLARHPMHSEPYEVPPATVAALVRARTRGARVVAVGTTVLRALEAAAGRSEAAGTGALPLAGPGETTLFITPGYRFRVVDTLVTNFHLPRSTLLMLVSAFAGTPSIRALYAHAIAARYRFFSYGDAMLLQRGP